MSQNITKEMLVVLSIVSIMSSYSLGLPKKECVEGSKPIVGVGKDGASVNIAEANGVKGRMLSGLIRPGVMHTD